MCKSIKKDQADSACSSKAEYSVDLFLQGYSCSECIVMAFADQFGLEAEIASKIASGFGFNAGREKEKTCGVVTGAIMIIGLKYGAGLKRDQFSIDLCNLVVHEFLNRFLTRRRSVVCKKIHLTYNKSETIRQLAGESAFCAKVTKDAASILEEILADEFG